MCNITVTLVTNFTSTLQLFFLLSSFHIKQNEGLSTEGISDWVNLSGKILPDSISSSLWN